MDLGLKDKVAIVTGGSEGIGKATARRLAAEGARVVIAARRPDVLRRTVDELKVAGDVFGIAADVTKNDDVARLIADTVARYGRIDILVNNAGTIRRHPAAEFPLEEWDAVIRTNLDSVFVLSQRLGRRMIERGAGKIVNVASLLSFQGGITVPAYTASKHAVAGLTKALANEWARHGVQVNAIAPGYFSTDNTQRLRDDPERLRDISARIPAARWGQPEDLGGAVVFLASRASDYVNGHVLVVDGGWMAR
jgi:2-deoxy-D-gluconate 3-dehydrogenase